MAIPQPVEWALLAIIAGALGYTGRLIVMYFFRKHGKGEKRAVSGTMIPG